MKNLVQTIPALAAVLAIALHSAIAAKETGQISTGKVSSVSEDKATLTIQSAQTHSPIIYYGLLDAQITAANGEPVGLDSVKIGANVTVYYTKIKDRLHVSRIVLPTPNAAAADAVNVANKPGVEVLPNAERRALKSDVLTDGDITTQPGSKATIDRDITTQPGSKAAIDRDITTQPGKIRPNDGDPTTKSAKKDVNRDGDITTKKDK